MEVGGPSEVNSCKGIYALESDSRVDLEDTKCCFEEKY